MDEPVIPQAVSNGEHLAILDRIAEMRVIVGRIDERMKMLPCREQKQDVEKIDQRVSLLESAGDFTRGAASAAKVIWGVVILGLIAIGGFVVSVVGLVRK